MKSEKKRLGFEFLEKEIIASGRCSGCAACVVACPRDALVYLNGFPELAGECKNCGICIKSCYRLNPCEAAMSDQIFGCAPDLENEPFGFHLKIIATRATDPDILAKCQDGGGTTALMQSAFNAKIVNGALVAGRKSGEAFRPEPILVTNERELLSCAGTCYTYSPNLLALRDGRNQLADKLILVGTPCQIDAYRQWQLNKIKYAKRIKLSISLFCTSSFTIELLKEKLIKEMQIELSQVEKMDIKGRFLLYMKSGEIKEIALKEVNKFARKACTYCNNFSGRMADISVGGIGADGWTVTVLRSKAGLDLFNFAVANGYLQTKPIEKFPVSLKLLERLSKKQLSRTVSDYKSEYR